MLYFDIFLPEIHEEEIQIRQSSQWIAYGWYQASRRCNSGKLSNIICNKLLLKNVIVLEKVQWNLSVDHAPLQTFKLK
jgi:hypothetical protein